MQDLRRALAFVFKRKGKAEISERDFVLSVSMDLRWFPPRSAQKLLDVGIESGSLERTEAGVRPAFDYKAMEIPFDFKPDEKILNYSKPIEDGSFLQLVDLIAASAGKEKKEVVSRVNRVQDRMGVDIEVAALIVAREFGIGVEKYIDGVEARILERTGQG